MPINKETIISVFDEKLTLMQWLKTINKALEDAVLTGVEITKKGNATLSFKFTFEDGTYLETNDLVLQQGESVANAFIQNGHLYLTLTNGTNLDAGNVKPVSNFSINASQHLIVNYGDGTSQDLGAIFSGNVNIDGNLTANSIIENMSDYAFMAGTSAMIKEITYAGIVKNGNKLTLVIAGILRASTGATIPTQLELGRFAVPQSVADKIYPSTLQNVGFIDNRTLPLFNSYVNAVTKYAYATKGGTRSLALSIVLGGTLTEETDYYFRYELTFLLSDNLAG